MSSQLKNMFSRCTVHVCCVLIVVGVAALRPGELLFTDWVPVYKPRRLSMGGAKVFRGWYGTTLDHVRVCRLWPKLTRSVRVGRRPSGAMHIHTVTKLCCMLLGLASAPGTRRQAHATSDTVSWERRLDGMTGKQLKALLALNSLKTSGNKTEQLRRVVDHIIRGAPRSDRAQSAAREGSAGTAKQVHGCARVSGTVAKRSSVQSQYKWPWQLMLGLGATWCLHQPQARLLIPPRWVLPALPALLARVLAAVLPVVCQSSGSRASPGGAQASFR